MALSALNNGDGHERTSFVPGLRVFGDDWPPDYADQDYTHNTMDVIAAIAHKHTKVTPESPGGSGIPA